MLQGTQRWESGCGEGQPLAEARSREPYLNVQTIPIKDQVGGGGSPQGTPRPGAGPLRCSPELWREPGLGAPLLAEGPAQLRHSPSHLAPRPPAALCVSLHHARLPSDGGLLCPEAEDGAPPGPPTQNPSLHRALRLHVCLCTPGARSLGTTETPSQGGHGCPFAQSCRLPWSHCAGPRGAKHTAGPAEPVQ